jgi:ABC-type taurine transport system ATPase subunit
MHQGRGEEGRRRPRGDRRTVRDHRAHRRLLKIYLPATLPYAFTGFRLSLGIAWLVIVASEMLTGAPGLGGFLWQDALASLVAKRLRTMIRVTHDVDKALFLSTRVAMMTSGPEAKLGGVLEVDFPRPRDRAALAADPRYAALREELLLFLEKQAA